MKYNIIYFNLLLNQQAAESCSYLLQLLFVRNVTWCYACLVLAGLAAVILGLCLIHGSAVPASSAQLSSKFGGPAGLAAPPPSAASAKSCCQLVLDVLVARVGLSQFFARLDGLQQSPHFAALAAGPKRLVPLARAAAGVVTGPEFEDAGGNYHHGTGHALGGMGAREGAGPNRGTAGPGGPEMDGLPPDRSQRALDWRFVELVKSLESSIKQTATSVFTTGAAPASAAAPPTVSAAQLPGSTDGEKLQAALAALSGLNAELSELRSRNKALAADVVKLSTSGGAGGGGGGGGHGSSHGNGGYDASGGVGRASSGGGALSVGGAMGDASFASGAADLAEARVAAELRAGRAEMEVATLRQQLAEWQARCQGLEAACSEAQATASEAVAAAARHEGTCSSNNYQEIHTYVY